MKITTIKVDYYVIPLEGNLVDALHGNMITSNWLLQMLC